MHYFSNVLTAFYTCWCSYFFIREVS